MTVKIWCGAMAATVMLCCSHTVFSWSANGHKTVALIAWDLLNKDMVTSIPAKNTVSKIQAILDSLGSDITLAAISPCADQLRGGDQQPTGVCAKFTSNSESKYWHYIDIPITASPQSASDLDAYCGDGDCVTDEIQANIQTLQTTTDLSSQQQALMYLVHFAADIHTPLHCAYQMVNGKSDDGGNSETIAFTPTGSNATYPSLHALWDHLIQPYDDDNDPKTLSQLLEASLPADTTPWTTGDYITDAALESFQFAQTNIYPDYNNAPGPDGAACQGSNLGTPYQTAMLPTVDLRLQKAGVRLEAWLISAFNTTTSATTAASPAITTPEPVSAN